MKESWIKLQGWFSSRNQREKILLSVVICGGLFVLAHYLWISPAQQQLQAEQQRHQQQRGEVASLSEEAQRFERQLAIDPNDELRRRESELTARKVRLEARLEERAQLMPARASVHWIDALLDMPSGLELVQFDTQRAVPMVVPDQSAEQNNLWQHPVQLVVDGQYHDLRDYVESIEALQYPFYWDQLRYEVGQFPAARLTIRVYALSTQEELLGG
ncbi:MAG: type II secretion system protein M [Idiomarina sp.]|nr:type II secretion system protein M [Idiomarina sp.]